LNEDQIWGLKGDFFLLDTMAALSSMEIMKPLLHRYLLTAALGLAFTAFAHAQLFDFESLPATFDSGTMPDRPGVFSGMAIASGGLTIMISREHTDRFDTVNNTTGNQTDKPASWGGISLDPFFSPGTNGFIANFSVALSAFSLEWGDYSFPDIDTLTLMAWAGPDGTGALLDMITVTQTDLFPQFHTAGVSAFGIQSVTWEGTSDLPGFENSVFYDNFQATVVPEASTFSTLLGASLVTMVVIRWRRRWV
jgi:hypothetical protein